MSNDDGLLDSQVAYYRARAAEYEEWWRREGRYDQGPEHRAEWLENIAVVESALGAAFQQKDVLELACGTGLWTRHLARHNRHVLAVDASPEVIALNREKVRSGNVDYLVADIFTWTPPARFEAAFFSFWLSHVPMTRFDRFWSMVRSALEPGGQVFFVDSLFEQSGAARDQGPLDNSGVVERRLNDGRHFKIVKVFHEPAALERRLLASGWEGWVRSSGKFFLYGSMRPAPSSCASRA
jgi:demethylmenaquinone methyltransferase/2-methoxy-6-polyprenyl-1,4-benzoquinol methylase